jgi:L-ribulokinase
MGRIVPGAYLPDPGRADVYDALYAEYVRLHDYFGRGGNEVLHRLRALRDTARGDAAPAGTAPQNAEKGASQ